jgi:hypothetical protein
MKHPTRILKWIGSLIFLLGSVQSVAAIEPIWSIEEVEFGESERHDTLLIFDVDDTLTILREPAYQRPNFKHHHAELFFQLMHPLDTVERVVAFTLPLLTTPSDLIELQTPEKIQKLQLEGMKVIALTAAMAGEIDKVFVEDRRIAELRRVGIEFSFHELPTQVLPNFECPIYGRPPTFKEGILFTNEVNKGEVLVAFLKTLAWSPKHIVFVDDRLEHLHTVEKALAEYDSEIRYQGFHFQSDPSCYQHVEPETFEQKWAEVADKAKEILSSFEAIPIEWL